MILICLKSLALEDAVRSLNVEPGEYFLSDTEISTL